MALLNTITNEYLKIDFGYLPLPVAKVFKTQAARVDFDQNFDNFKVQEFDVNAFNVAASIAVTDPLKPLLMDNFKSLAYAVLKIELNKSTVIWENC